MFTPKSYFILYLLTYLLLGNEWQPYNNNINIPVSICLQYSALRKDAGTKSGQLRKQEVYAENRVIKWHFQHFQKIGTELELGKREYRNNKIDKSQWYVFAPAWGENTKFWKQNESVQQGKQLAWPTASFYNAFFWFQNQQRLVCGPLHSAEKKCSLSKIVIHLLAL